ncbi:MAG TPA: hypothetical protein DEH78_25770 [Solibacterales bacterium]|nr:hypothetical protein [Bryobacterales bacterium]
MHWLSRLVGCRHERTTFPQKRRERGPAAGNGVPVGATYVACLECGREIPYDWEHMRRSPVRTRFARWIRREPAPVRAE